MNNKKNVKTFTRVLAVEKVVSVVMVVVGAGKLGAVGSMFPICWTSPISVTLGSSAIKQTVDNSQHCSLRFFYLTIPAPNRCFSTIITASFFCIIFSQTKPLRLVDRLVPMRDKHKSFFLKIF